ncbi:unnamed protein product [Arctia plantaginis]|uniref:DUF7041 domain-containing protein n=1 Tax=Arctia plantaginis TaxID=874455 RepID=A0A8S0Z262_ARCPL|nr:unnamed protein product [Arctia plantaginis]
MSEDQRQGDPAPITAKELSSGAVPQETFRVGARIPPFHDEKPALRFSQMEARFALANIKTDETKFYYVTGNLEDIITNHPPPPAPASDKYVKLKTELIQTLNEK